MRILFATLFAFVLLFHSVHADVPTAEEMRQIMLFNFASWCGNAGITDDWDCFPCKQPELRGFVLDGKVNNMVTVMFAYMGHINGTIWVVIRGTVPTSPTSWLINDFPIIPVPFTSSSGGLFNMRFSFVAAGFLSAWRSIERPLVNLMSQATTFCPECNRVIITGHSLGAAVASFAALRASSVMGIPRDRITLITSGGPRTGNAVFAQDVAASVGETYRIVFGGDIVTQLPAWTGPIGFTHFPTEILVSENGDMRVCSMTNGEDFSCANGLVFQPWRFININHFMFGNVMDPQMYTRMITTEPPERWCGVASANGPGLLMLLNHAESEYDDSSFGLSEEIAQANSGVQDTAANADTSEVATPAWAIGLIIVGCLVILALVVIIVSLAKMIKGRH